jgi:hypothetical protein
MDLLLMTDSMTHKHMELYVQLQQAQYLRPPFAKGMLEEIYVRPRSLPRYSRYVIAKRCFGNYLPRYSCTHYHVSVLVREN